MIIKKVVLTMTRESEEILKEFDRIAEEIEAEKFRKDNRSFGEIMNDMLKEYPPIPPVKWDRK